MKVFIGSSSEAATPNGLLDKIANIVQLCEKTPIKWNEKPTIFRASQSILENLEEIPKRENIEASIFICTEDDKTDYRGTEIKTPRDNVIFEHGLFSGKLGRQKSVIVKCGNVTLPNDIDGIICFDFSPGKDEGGAMDLKQWLNELKGTTHRMSYEELEKIKIELERELKIFKTKGLEKIFNDQLTAVDDLKDKVTDNSTIRILCIRGDSFVFNRGENWAKEILKRCTKTIVLGNPSNDELIMNRYNSNKNKDETESEFLERYRVEMESVQNKTRVHFGFSLYLHNEINLRYRMLFVDNCLYLSEFADVTASKGEVIKIPKGFVLYAVCEEYYNKILTNAIPK
jgi:hypothetical protein